MNAFFLIDKPSGQTSFALLKDMRKILQIKRMWHIGTLDPLATGLMLVASGEYTKCIPLLEWQDKSYSADIMLDGSSPSYDSDTKILFLSEWEQDSFKKSISQEQIQDIFLKHFSGKITQIPPKYSALKIAGKRALDRTLAGEDITMKARDAEIISFEIIEFCYPRLVIDIRVSSWTYIRSVAHDLWEILGTGGYLSALRRTSIGYLDIVDAITFSPDENILIEQADIQKIFWNTLYRYNDEHVYTRLSQWQRVPVDIDAPQDTISLLYDGQNIRYMVEYIQWVLHPRKKIT